jgi:hypothetical protein
VRRGAVADDLRELAAGDRRDVRERAERGEREERVAVAPQNPRVVRVPVAEVAEQHGLADPSLAGHEHQPSARCAHGRERRVESGPLRCAFQERGRRAGGGECPPQRLFY